MDLHLVSVILFPVRVELVNMQLWALMKSWWTLFKLNQLIGRLPVWNIPYTKTCRVEYRWAVWASGPVYVLYSRGYGSNQVFLIVCHSYCFCLLYIFANHFIAKHYIWYCFTRLSSDAFENCDNETSTGQNESKIAAIPGYSMVINISLQVNIIIPWYRKNTI